MEYTYSNATTFDLHAVPAFFLNQISKVSLGEIVKFTFLANLQRN